ncbi:MAG: 30S ribosomal protein S18 [Candidatus Kerfeldbacteria bacterium CG_4_10_14_0_8_um_filter_42_10]|uniref:Small ribosomal subunit protein bS18 n=1 Tax=Candidatus Kerfeldbacteria bacterium CG_4_10_14_0_8_um_filter_42_10 TaxID=2014248 RepID=A0A2M7RI36_9BACT|nr:MAG: 30S ribosomal protein S18 [Candidatus Kerfeldbacteria bacterium CG_4_10_14_0_8_um_filter_42_10]
MINTRTTSGLQKQKQCFFCTNGINEIDYKDTKSLQRFLSSYAKILPRKKTGTCAKHQRKLAQSVKRARHMALIPYTTR